MDSDQAIEFTGNLALDSEKLFSKLKKVFQPKDFGFLLELYAFRKNIYPVEEENLNRSVGANYNPKLARIALLYLNEGQGQNLFYTAAIIAMQNHINNELFKIPSKFSKEFQMAKELDEALSELEICPEDQEHQTILLAALLDEIRHLHMEITTNESKNKRLTKIQNFIENLPQCVLKTKCLHALSLQKQKLSKASKQST
jgi:hypothetical protein